MAHPQCVLCSEISQMAGVSKLFSELNLVKDNLFLIFKVGVAILVKAFDGF